MKHLSLIFILFCCSLITSCQQDKTLQSEQRNLKKGLAISGYDPVTYFIGKPTKGNSTINFVYNDATYQFTNEKNKKTFVGDPEKYEPAYGGWCAYAMGLEKAEKVSINPKTFKIIDDKLYLYYNKFGINTLDKWNKDEKKLKMNADRNWKEIIDEL